MHEMSLAVNIVDLAILTARQENKIRVSEIEIEVGNLAGVMIESLEFCLAAAAQSTVAENASFRITCVPARGICDECGHEFAATSFFDNCPECNGIAVKISGGQDLKVKSVTIEDNHV